MRWAYWKNQYTSCEIEQYIGVGRDYPILFYGAGMDRTGYYMGREDSVTYGIGNDGI